MDLNVHDVARLLQVSEKTIYRWLNQGKIPAYRLNDQYRFNRAELLEWIATQKLHPAVDLLWENESRILPLPSLVSALSEGGIYYRIGGATRHDALREAVRLMRLPDAVNREQLLQVLLAREALGSTGIGGGVAIPHPRTPMLPELYQASISMCFLEHPIPFEALDGQPVHTMLVMVSPNARAHIHLLSRLVYALHDAVIRDLLKTQGSRDQIMREFKRIDELLPARTDAVG